MDQLCERLGVRVNFCVLKSGKLTFVEWVDSSSPVRIDLKPGVPVPVHASASGKLLMAFAPEQVRERFLATGPFHAFTRSTITSAEAMRRELALIRRRGHAEDHQEFLSGISCLAVPVRNRSGEVVAGLGVMAPAHDFPLAQARQNLSLIRACADAISADAGRNAPLGGAATAAGRGNAGRPSAKPAALRQAGPA